MVGPCSRSADPEPHLNLTYGAGEARSSQRQIRGPSQGNERRNAPAAVRERGGDPGEQLTSQPLSAQLAVDDQAPHDGGARIRGRQPAPGATPSQCESALLPLGQPQRRSRKLPWKLGVAMLGGGLCIGG